LPLGIYNLTVIKICATDYGIGFTFIIPKGFEKRKNYSPESIKIRFIFRPSGGEAAAKASPAPPMAGLGERTPPSSKNEFVSNLLAPDKKQQQTFEIILPNLIHKSKKRNLK